MENFTLFDTAALVLVCLSALLAYFRGISREILSIISWISAFIFAFVLAPFVNPVIERVPVINEILADSCQLSIVLSFIISFVICLILLSLFVPLITNFVNKSSLSGLDRNLGLLFGFFRGALIIVILLIGYDSISSGDNGIAIVENSRTKEIFYSTKIKIKDSIPEKRPKWISKRIESLMYSCGEPI